MDQNQPKSVWLKLILPICLGVFATAIYHNAIKTQRAKITGLKAAKAMQAGKEIDVDVLMKSFEAQPITFHNNSPKSLKDSFTEQSVRSTVEDSPKLILIRPLSEGEFVSMHDFRKSE